MRHCIAPLLLLTLLAAAPAQAGWSFRQSTRTTGSDEPGGSGDSQVSIEDGNARIAFGGSLGSQMFGPGSYMLMRNNAPQGLFLVDPSHRTYSSVDPEEMTQMTQMAQPGGGAPGSGMQMEITGAAIEKLLEEAGMELQGLPTTHYRYHKTYAMTIGMGPMKMTTVHDIMEDVWSTTAVDFGAGNLGETMSMIGEVGGMGGLAELAKLEAQKPAGFILKQVTVDHSEPKGGKGMMARMMRTKGQAETYTSTIEILDLVEADIPAATFAIPDGYSETQWMQPGLQAPSLEN
jgi:hypothetical protein